ncbi:MAG: 50S ribosomal protein L11 methyltransferase [Rhodospirillaceae bacterium]|jgi:ribosomal protein L11 methyltransferase|nr:50S ribosomal protein L11 methyltransferase [Rhodospirillaceae bacterium]MBT4218668.1 50S ribosomal protein L11 methyltransferase [Rhodospirillaceae bacterium]MBT4463339.1 50S ribosomal protein L11 methyltransferase [Rhodospirillaceae bacterium]MBT5013242.1 50S ribosomal protein L11 methyltransferase [Rhodospirillaceae bacterium]MBT5309614.1 50S ribosomal protein L11 methyltransferase [Rhodospirillaceae bacterium]
MKNQTGLWRVEVAATADSVNAFEDALAPFCEAVSWFATDSEGEWRIEGFTEQCPDGADLADAMTAVATSFSITVPEVTVIPVKPRDWVAESLALFPPTEAGRYFIHGTHYETSPPPGRIDICLNPGRAFGSGDHATTRGCLLALDELARSHTFKTPLDMGCGSGILAIAMARTWMRRVVAADIDIKAVVVARENVRRNRVARFVRPLRGNGFRARRVAASGPYDLIVSNILANPLCRMAVDVARHLRGAKDGGGFVVLSGFYQKDAGRVYAAYRRQGLRLVRSYDIGKWRTLVLERRPR